jgi:hypothetical protein
MMQSETPQVGDRVEVIAPTGRLTIGKTGTVESYAFVDGWFQVKLDKRFKSRQRYMFQANDIKLLSKGN